ncbi:oxygen-independent coproporphyrinogen III oxidase [Methylorubrum populi BJ001]|uniref:Coproporphyrinogen-III oxidase n=1 Tax=Methylorubrum populi (strain ATCC BAA-705 / NCIMB 13946 / BJ001) TaxID=441620 RepID=B1ZJ39_METPB|nr:oxygen-independent coproporphyrinogen III oxidase [Methylorubrum populi]ACB78613.1 oxygen-independent coproporphyrinogen III oxidase [Methylorubrum populi BJ001]OAH20109.1 coproporphyrinogen III oxidase [Methylorubrum populi]PZP69908.1 MAG: oxygen-independent coproporphyrinogen III oxidase [Methylorubrum populi]
MRQDLKAHYADERLPRYTSYPASPHFTGAVGPAAYAEWLRALPAETTASLYLHVPFCRSLCWYCGCHTHITRHDAPIDDYLASLRKEIGLVAGHLERRPAVRHVHFGGGTPTIMAPAAFRELMALLRAHFPFAPEAEIAVEIDPRTLAPAMIRALGEAGVTRASLGVQSFDPAVQAAIRRRQDYAVTEAAVAGLRAAGIRRINLDLIYGLPHQSVESCVETVRQCLALRPDRLAVFGYAHVPSFKKHQRLIDAATLPDAAARRAQAQAVADALAGAGYRRIGLDHYALPDDPMAVARAEGQLHRNFQGYTTDSSDALIGFGASAIGRLPQGYVQNEPALRAYAARVAANDVATVRGYALTPEDRLRAALIERIMCDGAVEVGAVCRSHGRDPEALLASLPRLRALTDHGLVKREGMRLTIPDDARAFVRNVAALFDAHLGTSAAMHSCAA